MSFLLASIQILGVTVGAFGVFSLLQSHFRYRRLQLELEAESRLDMNPAAACFLVLEHARRHKHLAMGLRFQPGDPERIPEVVDILKTITRRDDQVAVVKNGAVLVLLVCPPEHLAAAANRLSVALTKKKLSCGTLRMWACTLVPEEIREWVEEPPSMENNSENWIVCRKGEPPPPPPEPLEDSPVIDPLTRVLRPDRVPRALRRILAEHRRRGTPLVLARVDVDQLREYNQTLGIEVGDALLRAVAERLMNTFRETDFIGRVAEDEFLLCMSVDPEGGRLAALRMCGAVKDEPFDVERRALRVTAGFGLAGMPEDGSNPVQLFDCAGLALEEAKRRGRGQLAVYDDSMRPRHAAEKGNEQPESF